MPFQLNPRLDRRALQAAYKRDGRIHVPDILSAESAAALYELLKKLTYDLVFTGGDGHVNKVQAEHWRVQPEAKRQKFIEEMAYRGAGPSLRFFYGQFDIEQFLRADGENGSLSREIWAYLNSAEYLTLLSDLTGDGLLRGVHVQASCYEPGHFLTVHDDIKENVGRRVAFVLNLSASWQGDWGGLLHFHGADGHIVGTHTPTFNALSLFTVPTLHSVSTVMPMARQSRYALTGWALDRDAVAIWPR